MTTKEAVIKCMKSRGETYRSIGEKLNITFASVSDRLNKGNMRSDNLIEMLDVMGFDLLIRDRKNDSALYKIDGIPDEETLG